MHSISTFYDALVTISYVWKGLRHDQSYLGRQNTSCSQPRLSSRQDSDHLQPSLSTAQRHSQTAGHIHAKGSSTGWYPQADPELSYCNVSVSCLKLYADVQPEQAQNSWGSAGVFRSGSKSQQYNSVGLSDPCWL